MNYNTIHCIHTVLVDELRRRTSALEMMRRAYNEAEDNNAENLETLKAAYQHARESYNEVDNALRDFEDHEWR